MNRLSFILRFRVILVALILAISVVMSFFALKVRLSYQFGRVLPDNNKDLRFFNWFRSEFGSDDNTMVVGVSSDSMYSLLFYRDWYRLEENIRKLPGVTATTSNTHATLVQWLPADKKFGLSTMKEPMGQADVTNDGQVINQLPFYNGQLYNPQTKSYLILISFDANVVHSKDRAALVQGVVDLGNQFSKTHEVSLHYSGLSYIRTVIGGRVAYELKLFIELTLFLMIAVLAFLFRSIKIVICALTTVGLGVLWTLGLVGALDFEITMLTGLIPALIIIIGIPNSILFFHKYQAELRRSGSKIKALHITLHTVGETTFLANITTAIGFAVFCSSGSALLFQFGLIASAGILITFLISLLLTPVLLSYLNIPAGVFKSVLHNPGRLEALDKLVRTRRSLIYVIVCILTCIALVGVTRLKGNSFVIDDLSRRDPIYQDMKYFERNFGGIIPLEILVDGGRRGAATSLNTIDRMRALERKPFFRNRHPNSILGVIKYAYQEYRGGDPKYYAVPSPMELNKLAHFILNSKSANKSDMSLFTDSTRRYSRISTRIDDMGARRTDSLLLVLQPSVDSVFNYNPATGTWADRAHHNVVTITGNSILFAKGNGYLIHSLEESSLIALLLIVGVMGLQFKGWRLILASIVPSLLPPIAAAAIMGFSGIPLKPSTILIFSIAFGLSSDATLYFTSKVKQELKRKTHGDVAKAVSDTLLESGWAILSTMGILVLGFGVFVFSGFMGTVYMGILIPATLLFSLISNMMLLPALIIDAKTDSKTIQYGTTSVA